MISEDDTQAALIEREIAELKRKQELLLHHLRSHAAAHYHEASGDSSQIETSQTIREVGLAAKDISDSARLSEAARELAWHESSLAAQLEARAAQLEARARQLDLQQQMLHALFTGMVEPVGKRVQPCHAEWVNHDRPPTMDELESWSPIELHTLLSSRCATLSKPAPPMPPLVAQSIADMKRSLSVIPSAAPLSNEPLASGPSSAVAASKAAIQTTITTTGQAH